MTDETKQQKEVEAIKKIVEVLDDFSIADAKRILFNTLDAIENTPVNREIIIACLTSQSSH